MGAYFRKSGRKVCAEQVSGNAGSVSDEAVLPVIFCLLFFLICTKVYGTAVTGH